MLSVLLNLTFTGLFLVLRTLAQAGGHDKPSLSAWPSHIVPQGHKVEFQCDSHGDYYIFKFYKEYGDPIPQILGEPLPRKFVVNPVTPAYAGTYRCYGINYRHHNPNSAHSDPVKIIISGLYKKPSLSALMGPVVMSGENMTLSCVSDLQFDMFHLSREGVPQGHGLPAVQSHSGTFQSNFHLGPMVQAGNYSCYGSFRNSSYVWSTPSDPLSLPVTGNCTSCTDPDFKTNNHSKLHILIGISVTMILVFLVMLLYFCGSAKKTIMDQDSELRTTLNRQDPERQEVREVTYLEFDQMIFKQNLTTRNSQVPKEFSTDPSVYMEVRKC